MALNIKNPEAEALIKQLAERTGQSKTTAVTVAAPRRRATAEELMAIGRDCARHMSAAGLIARSEAAAVVERSRSPVSIRRLGELLRQAEIAIGPVTVERADTARAACRDFGKGGGHPARLNLGDCFAYALAKTAREPLLCKGDDFSDTDRECVRLGPA